MRYAAILAAFAAVLLIPRPADAQQRYSVNGHYYEAVSTSETWSNAKAEAEKATYSGMKGHLVTITSSGENSFVDDTVLSGQSGSWWIGAFQKPGTSEPNGGWEWVTGETWSYTNWNTNEPNDSGGEDVAEFYTSSGRWNDNKTSSSRNYVVEYTPVAEMTINADDGATDSTSVTLHLEFESGDDAGTPQVRFRNAGGTWSGWSTYSTTASWSLPTGEGTKTVEVEFKDAYGLVYTDSDEIDLDTSPPTGTVVIEDGATWTSSTTVTLTLNYSDQYSAVASMRFRNDGGAWGDWTAAASSHPWEIEAETGLRIVDAEFRDQAGNVSSVASDSINLDLTPPEVTLTIEDGDSHTKSKVVAMRIDATDVGSGVGEMRFREQGVPGGWDPWVPYQSSYTRSVVPGSGLRGIDVQVRDVAGNVSSVESDTITLDNAPPEVTSFRVNDGQRYVLPDEDLVFEVYGQDNPGGSGVAALKTSFDGGQNWSDWYPLLGGGGDTKVDRPAEDGLVTVTIVIRDALGNESDRYTEDTYLVEADLPVATGGGKLTGTINPAADVDGFVVDLTEGDALTVSLKGKASVKGQTLLLGLDILTADGRLLHVGRYPQDAKKPMIKGFVAPETGQYYILARLEKGSPAQSGSLKISAKVKQSKTRKKGKGTAAGEDIRIHACRGSLLKLALKGDGLTAADVTVVGPDGPVAFEAKEGKGSVAILTVLDAGTGVYTVRIAGSTSVSWKWSLKLPKKIKEAING